MTLDTYKCGGGPPKIIEVQGDDRQFSSWEKTLRDNLKPGVQVIVLILQG